MDLLTERREVILKSEAETYIRPADIAFGQLRCALEPGAPDDLLRRLALFLERETDVVWQVDQVESASETLKARRARILAEKIDEAARHPTIAAALKALPGAKVVDVRQEAPIDPAGDAPNVVDMKPPGRRRA